MIVNTGHKTFDKLANGPRGYVGRGNVISAALQSVFTPGDDVLPSFSQIKSKFILSTRSEPRNKSFVVQIRKVER